MTVPWARTINVEGNASLVPSTMVSSTMQPALMPIPHSRYLRPTLDPATAESHRTFRQTCASGDLPAVTSLIGSQTRNADYLTQGLLAAINQEQIQICEYLINSGAVIDRDISNAAASVKSIPIFKLLVEHGWDVNSPVIGGEPILLFVMHIFSISLIVFYFW